jgi:hypothetical protein
MHHHKGTHMNTFIQSIAADTVGPHSGSHGPAQAHWLLYAVYGRDLLKARLRKAHPELAVRYWARQPELDPALERTIDDLRLRSWPRPRSFADRLRYLMTVVRMKVAIESGSALPGLPETSSTTR